MESIPTFARVDLTHIDTSLYKELTSPTFFPLLSGKDLEGISGSQIIAVEGRVGNELVALALATYRQYLHYAEVNSIFVKPAFRRQKIATQLLALLQNEVKKEQGTALAILYQSDEEFSPAWQAILKANQWPEAKPFVVKLKFLRATFNPPWIHHPIQFPKGFQEFPWSEVTEDEKSQIQRMLTHRVVSYTISPFFEQERIEPMNSLGLRRGEELMGWVVTHRIDPETIRYTSLFIDRSLRFHLFSTKLLIDAIQLQKKSLVKWAIFELPLIQVHPSWTQFVEKRLIPYADEIKFIVQSWRQV